MTLDSNFKLLCLLLFCGRAIAATPAEEHLFKSSMPHERIAVGGKFVRVHHVRLQGYLEGKPSNKTRLSQLKEAVSACVRRYQNAGRTVRIQDQWPDHLLSSREDIYYAENRRIRYTTVIAYVLNPADCSLMENISRTADLVSTGGTCNVDLASRTAKGYCPSDGHASSLVNTKLRGPAAGDDDGLKQLARDPRMAVAVASIRKTIAFSNAASGRKKSILGLECEVWDQPAAPGGGSACYTNKGSFVPSRVTGLGAEAGMLLEFDSKYGFKMKAVSAKLDNNVSPAVFAPYNRPGFTRGTPIVTEK